MVGVGLCIIRMCCLKVSSCGRSGAMYYKDVLCVGISLWSEWDYVLLGCAVCRYQPVVGVGLCIIRMCCLKVSACGRSGAMYYKDVLFVGISVWSEWDYVL